MNELRNAVMSRLNDLKKTWYWLSTEANINTTILYRFRDGKGIDGENTIKIIRTLNIDINELN